MKHILVVGGNSKLARVFIAGKLPHEELIITTRTELDLIDTQSIDRFINNQNGSFDAVVIFAGMYEAMNTSIDTMNIKKHLVTNALGPLHLVQNLSLSQGAMVIFFTDAGGIQPKPGFLGYTFSKMVLRELIRILAVKLAPTRKIIGIGLGPTKVSHKSLVTVPDPIRGVIDLVRFLIHNENIYASGCIIPFDGGTYIKRVV
jgi:NAD(P)-dependent dehydrogenase (short-subunit alcohol dehydrogenase family)